ncbi:MAG: hypothetical protein AABN95_02370 [Acidobacteriota bacterium]
MLTENAQFLTKEQLGQHVSRLNQKGFQTLDAEWEVAVLNAFSKLGKIEHEPGLEGAAKLDLLFTHDSGSSFLADVVSVSDEGYEEKKAAVRTLYGEVQKRLEAAGLMHRRWTVTVGSHRVLGPGEEPRVAIPSRRDFEKKIFNTDFQRFLKSVNEHPDRRQTYRVITAGTAITLNYEPEGVGFVTSRAPVSKRAVLKNRNPIFNALRAKAKQLKKVSYEGPKGIILCDGGSEMVHSQPHGAFEFNFNAVDAAKDFLRQNQSVDFVLMLSSVWVQTGRYPPIKPPFRRIQVTVIPNKCFEHLPEAINETLTKLEECFPEPDNTPNGARETIRRKYDPKQLRPLAGGWEVSDKKIKISASAVLSLLAGAVTQAELFNSLGFKPQSTKAGAIRNPFEYVLNKKMRIDRISVEETSHDDSHLVFYFEGRDPALSAFSNPKQ